MQANPVLAIIMIQNRQMAGIANPDTEFLQQFALQGLKGCFAGDKLTAREFPGARHVGASLTLTHKQLACRVLNHTQRDPERVFALGGTCHQLSQFAVAVFEFFPGATVAGFVAAYLGRLPHKRCRRIGSRLGWLRRS